MKKTLASLLAVPVLVATLSNCSPQLSYKPSLENYVHKSKIPPAPQYTKYKNSKLECAGYAVLVSRDMFHKDMIYTAAWDILYHNKLVKKVNAPSELLEDTKKGILKPGMIVALKNPHSIYNFKKDEKGKRVKWTHLATYAGKENNELYFYHKYGKTIEKVSLKKLLNYYGVIPKAIFDEPTSKSYLVKKGDTAWAISKRFKIPLSKLKKLNPKKNLTKIYPNEIIKIK